MKSAETIQDVNRLIAGSTEQQGHGIDNIKQRIELLNQLSQETAATTQLALESSNEFTSMAMQLENLVSGFLIATEDEESEGSEITLYD